MKLRKTKKGFTVVELVIVIAVIAVLAAILIPTFISLDSRAKKASDQSLVKNLNTALAAQEGEVDDTKNSTMHDAVVDLEKWGYKLDALVTKSGEDLLWNMKTNRFLLEKDLSKEENKDHKVDFWRIQKSLSASDQFSVYASDAFSGAASDLKVGFDAGDNDDIPTVSYVGGASAQEVVIRTKGGSLTIDAASDTVHHYGDVDEVLIKAIANASYHENGKVKTRLVINQGHAVIEQQGEVPEVDVQNATGAVKVTANTETLIIADSASTSQTTVVANSSNVYVTGVNSESISGSKASEVELPTVVSNETQMNAAFSAKKKYIQLGADFEINSSNTVESDMLFDFNGHTVTTTLTSTIGSEFVAAVDAMDEGFTFVNRPFIRNSANLIVTDTDSDGGIVSANNNIIINEGKLTVNGGSFKSTCMLHKYFSGVGTTDEQDTYMASLGYKRGILHNVDKGTMIINNIDLETPADYGLLNCGVATINGGNFVSTSNSTNNTAYSYCISSKNNITINGGNVVGQHGCICVNGGTGVINDVNAETKKGTPSSGYYRALYVAGEVAVAGVEVNGGFFKSYNMEALLTGNKSDGGVGALAMTTINNGTFINGLGGTNPAVKVSGGTAGNNYGIGMMTIKGGSFSSDVSGATGVITCTQVGDLWIVNA